MKLTKAQLKHLIREELETTLLAEDALSSAYGHAGRKKWWEVDDAEPTHKSGYDLELEEIIAAAQEAIRRIGGNPQIIQINDPRHADRAVAMGQAPSDPRQPVTTVSPGRHPVTVPGAQGTTISGPAGEIANAARADIDPWWKFWEGQNRSNLEQVIREELVGVLKETNGYSGYTKAYTDAGEVKSPGRRIKGRADVSKIKSAEKHAKKTDQGPITGVEVSSLQKSLPVGKGDWETSIDRATGQPTVGDEPMSYDPSQRDEPQSLVGGGTGGFDFQNWWDELQEDKPKVRIKDVEPPGSLIPGHEKEKEEQESGEETSEALQRHIAQLEERLRAYDYYYTTLYENHTKLNETYKNTINENKNKKETISNKAKKRFESLKKENKNHRELVLALKEKLDEVNLSNAKLLYTNRVLNSDSLNERQKDKIVEAVSKAGSVGEAKTIFETLQSAVEGASTSKKASKSLNEAVARNSSAFLPHKEVKNSDPSLVDRMQQLAGITKI